jgi:biopolymer transport protein TolQ
VTVDTSFVSYFLDASLVVQLVMIILVLASFFSWVVIFQRGFYLRWTKKETTKFEKKFHAATDLTQLYQAANAKESPDELEQIFVIGYEEFYRLKKQANLDEETIIERVKRAMEVAHTQIIDELENHLPFLATVGSVAPYVGLFGTVWGIMNAFQALGHVTQATIAMVAPGISEALIATALGLFAAIPAVVAYNKYTSTIDRLVNRFAVFEEHFCLKVTR